MRVAQAQVAPPSQCFLPGTLEDGDPCTYPLQCQSFVCLRSYGTSCGHCAAPLDLGADCAGVGSLIGSPCGPGRTCADGVCGPPAQEGEPCSALLGECDLWTAALVCNPFTSTCVAGAFAGPGEECGVEGEVPTACAASDCYPSQLSGTCVARAADGEPCDVDVGPACLPHAHCVDGVCEQYFTPACG
jgi:hypothetical protein